MNALVLKSDRLEVSVAAPGSEYNLTRFDYTGNVKQIKLDGKHTFLGKEQPRESQKMGGFGMHNEFRIFGHGDFLSSPPGSECLKIGVGILKKADDDNGDYNFRYLYPNRTFDIKVDSTADSAVYSIDNIILGDISLSYKKTLKVSGNTLAISYELANNGAEISFRENSHNFLVINNKDIGTDYALEFSSLPSLEPVPERFYIENSTILFRNRPEDYYLHSGIYENENNDAWFKLSNKAENLICTCEMDFAPARLTFYGRADVICPEVFFETNLKNSSVAKWTRKYTFDYIK